MPQILCVDTNVYYQRIQICNKVSPPESISSEEKSTDEGGDEGDQIILFF